MTKSEKLKFLEKVSKAYAKAYKERDMEGCTFLEKTIVSLAVSLSEDWDELNRVAWGDPDDYEVEDEDEE